STLPGTPTASLSVNDIAFRDANNGVAYVYNTSTNPATFEMYNTTDGGATWTQIATVDPNAGRNDICRIPGTNLFASAGAGTGNYLVSYSNDNGVTWNNWGSTNIQYLSIDFVSPEVGWAGTFSDAANSSLGGIYKYTGASQNNDAFAAFSMSGFDCAPATVTVNNFSTGTPANTYTWTSFPPTAAFSSSTAASPTITFASAGQYTVTLTANNGTATSVSNQVITVASCTGINDLTADVKFAVYPNPTSGTLNIKLADGTSNFKYTVHNILGTVVASENVKNQDNVSINLANQAAGVYFVTIENNGKKSTQKIVVE
ncbi:MAG: T9SS type A sorting domain-containing protein, partial [Bacteroidia bacterium]|nr:T9SS type A sorting domain-containing protein [Bacteroidia bacterium]